MTSKSKVNLKSKSKKLKKTNSKYSLDDFDYDGNQESSQIDNQLEEDYEVDYDADGVDVEF